MENKLASQQIDDIVKNTTDWRGKKLSKLRAVILQADPVLVEEVENVLQPIGLRTLCA